MPENITNKIEELFEKHNFSYFHFNEIKNTIDLERSGNSADTVIFNELGIITDSLMNMDIDFSIDIDGSIILS